MANDYLDNKAPSFYKSKNAIFKKGSRTNKAELEIIQRYKKALATIDKQLAILFNKVAKNGEGSLTYTEINKANKLNLNLASIQSKLKSLHVYNDKTTTNSLTRLAKDSYKYSKNLAKTTLKLINPNKIKYPDSAGLVNKLQKTGETLASQQMKAKNYFPNKTILKIKQAFLKTDGTTLSELMKITKEAINSDTSKAVNILRTNSTRVANEASQLVYKTIINNKSIQSKIKTGSESTSDLIRKKWNHTAGQDNPRNTHIDVHGQLADNDGYFTVDGQMIEAPGMFGEPKNDSGCLCYITFELKK